MDTKTNGDERMKGGKDIEVTLKTKEDPIDFAKIREELEKESKNYTIRHCFSPEEDEILKKFYGKVPMKTIGEKLGRTLTTIDKRVDRLGLPRIKSQQPIRIKP